MTVELGRLRLTLGIHAKISFTKKRS